MIRHDPEYKLPYGPFKDKTLDETAMSNEGLIFLYYCYKDAPFGSDLLNNVSAFIRQPLIADKIANLIDDPYDTFKNVESDSYPFDLN